MLNSVPSPSRASRNNAHIIARVRGRLNASHTSSTATTSPTYQSRSAIRIWTAEHSEAERSAVVPTVNWKNCAHQDGPGRGGGAISGPRGRRSSCPSGISAPGRLGRTWPLTVKRRDAGSPRSIDHRDTCAAGEVGLLVPGNTVTLCCPNDAVVRQTGPPAIARLDQRFIIR
jgi:hypothetical protein